jgi:hypothetical protein
VFLQGGGRERQDCVSEIIVKGGGETFRSNGARTDNPGTMEGENVSRGRNLECFALQIALF